MVNLRILYDENVICEDILKENLINNKVVGYKLKTRLAYYQNLPVSSINKFELIVDEKNESDSAVAFFLDKKQFEISQLPELYTKYWYFIDKAELIINIPGGLSEGSHNIDLKFQMKRSYTHMMPLKYAEMLIAI